MAGSARPGARQARLSDKLNKEINAGLATPRMQEPDFRAHSDCICRLHDRHRRSSPNCPPPLIGRVASLRRV
jgi:hypothetical protein